MAEKFSGTVYESYILAFKSEISLFQTALIDKPKIFITR